MRLLLILIFASALWADAGKVQFQRKAGPFDITLLSDPATIRLGKPGLSVMVQRTATQTPVLDATVRLRLTKRESGVISNVIVPATHEHAANKMLYGAQPDIATAGKWRVEITVERTGESALVAGDIDVAAAEPPLVAHWPYLAVLPVLALLFAFNQMLRRRRLAARTK